MRAIFEISPESGDLVDWVADDAVCCERLSASNSLIIRENTGNFRDFSPPGADLEPKKPHILLGFSLNSLLN